MTALWLFLSAICVLGPLVALHEWGHYIVARLCGVKVLTYSIGMGPRLFGWTSKRSGIDYRISVLPLGGYVKMLDEREGEVDEQDKPYAFNNAHPLKKIAIVAAGPAMNFLIAIGLFCVIFMTPKEQLAPKIGSIAPNSPAADSGLVVKDTIVAIDNKAVDDWQAIVYALADRAGETGQVMVGVQNQHGISTHAVAIDRFLQSDEQKRQNPLEILGIGTWQPTIVPTIGQIAQGSAADLMGLKVGDTITAIALPDQTQTQTNPAQKWSINTWQDITPIIRQHPEAMLVFHILRDNQAMTVDVMPQAVKIDGQTVGQLGVQAKITDVTIPDEFKMTAQDDLPTALTKSVVKTYDLSLMTVKSMGKMLSGLIGLDNLSGPISIAQISKQSIEIGWLQLFSTAALISLSLAVLNLLPIPVLDGGHILYALYELIAGKPLSERVQIAGLNVGMLMLLGLMLIAIGNDISRVFG